MPGNVPFPYSGNARDRAALRRHMGKGDLFHFLDFDSRDTFHVHDDFDAKAVDSTNVYTLATGATATAFTITAIEDGATRGVSGTTAATSGLQIYIPNKLWYGDRNCGMEVRYRLSAITEIRFECGFVDALPAVNTTCVNNLTTPTFNTVADGALYVYDETGGTTTTGMYTIGSSISAAKVATTTNRPVAATWQTVRLQIIGDLVYMWVDGLPLASPSATQHIEGGNGLLAVLCSQKTANTTSKNIDIDYVRVWKDRGANA